MTIEYTYDQNSRLSGITFPGQGQITTNGFLWNSPVKTIFPGASAVHNTYDALMRVDSIAGKDPGQNTLLSRNYQYSPAGNITSKETEHGTYTYGYDNLYRLISADNPTTDNESYTSKKLTAPEQIFYIPAKDLSANTTPTVRS